MGGRGECLPGDQAYSWPPSYSKALAFGASGPTSLGVHPVEVVGHGIKDIAINGLDDPERMI